MSYIEDLIGLSRRTIMSALVIVLGMATTPASAAMVEIDEIPTRLVVPSEPIGYPDPVCLGCKLVAKRSTTTTATGDRQAGVLTVTYQDEAHLVFVGDVILTLSLFGTDERRIVVLDDVELTNGQATEFFLDPGQDWSWDEVEAVWIELSVAS